MTYDDLVLHIEENQIVDSATKGKWVAIASNELGPYVYIYNKETGLEEKVLDWANDRVIFVFFRNDRIEYVCDEYKIVSHKVGDTWELMDIKHSSINR